MIPAAEKTLRSRPPQAGHVVNASSVKLCTTSSRSSHAVQAYWYVGTGPSSLHDPTNLTRGREAGTHVYRLLIVLLVGLVSVLAVPTGQFAASADGAQPAFGGVARAGRRHDQQLVAGPQHRARVGHEAEAVPDDKGDQRLGRQPQFEDLYSVQLGVRGDADLEHVGVQLF